MSDNAQIIISLDPRTEEDRAQSATRLADWLLGQGVIGPYTGEPDDPSRTDWAAGPSWGSVVEGNPTGAPIWIYSGVDLTGTAEVVSAFAASDPWACHSCGAEVGWDAVSDLIDQWADTKIEPITTCGTCGSSGLLGDMAGENPQALVGAPTITFHNWPPLLPEFRDEVTTRIGGGRCRYFWQHL